MTRLVVDASVAAKWLISEDGTEAALRLRDPGYELVCPALLFLEVDHSESSRAQFLYCDDGTTPWVVETHH